MTKNDLFYITAAGIYSQLIVNNENIDQIELIRKTFNGARSFVDLCENMDNGEYKLE